MKLRDLLAHLHAHGCALLREGRRHSIYWHPLSRHVTSIPRHHEIDDFLARKICRDLGVPKP